MCKDWSDSKLLAWAKANIDNPKVQASNARISRRDPYAFQIRGKKANGEDGETGAITYPPCETTCTQPTYDQWGTEISPGTCGGTTPPLTPPSTPTCQPPNPDHGCASHAYQKNWNPVTCSWDQVRCDSGCSYETGWCKDPNMREPPYTGGDNTACSKGNSYAGDALIALTRQCEPGYDAVGGLLNTKCVCSSLSDEEYFKESPKAVQEFYETPENQQEGPGLPDLTDPNWFGDLGNIMKVLPTLIIMIVVVQIIGAFRK